MKNLYSKGLFAAACLLAMIGRSQPFVQTYTYTGAVQTWTVPSCVTSISIDARGAQGANSIDVLTSNSTGGRGGLAQGVLAVTPGQVLYIYVGGAGGTNGTGGFNGGGAGGVSTAGGSCFGGPAGGGGGASDIRVNGTALANRVIVAGGGGGAGRDYCNGTCQPCGCGGSGGAGGGLSGNNGVAANNCGFSYAGNGTNGGIGGSQSGGGNGGFGDNNGPSGNPGTSGSGGSGAGGSYDVAGGGGGGGFYGGGGGGGASNGSGVGGGGGGGGSSYVAGLTNSATTSSVQTGNGIVTFSYTYNGGVVAISPTAAALCSGNSLVLGASGVSSYTWVNNGSNAQNISVAPTSNTTYTVMGTNGNGCISSAIVNVTVNSSVPSLSINSSTTQVCIGKSVTLTASGALSHTWNNNVSNGVGFSPTMTAMYVVTGTNGCGTSTAAITITAAPLPVLAQASPTLICAFKPATLIAVSSGTSYAWSPGVSISPTVVVSPGSTTIYTVSATDGTCSGTGTVLLSVDPNPTVMVSASTVSICPLESVTLTAVGAQNYTWYPGALNGNQVIVNPAIPTSYTVTGDNQFGCLHTVNQVILVAQAPTLQVTPSTTYICSGDPVAINVSGAVNYTWSTNSNTNVIFVNPVSTTTFVVTGGTPQNSCTATEYVVIEVFEPTVAVSGNTAICPGNTVTISASGADSYTWSNQDQSAVTQVNPIITTIFTVSALTNSNTVSCPSSNTVMVTVYPDATITAHAQRTVMCRGETNTVSAGGGVSYLWNNNNAAQSFTIKPTNNNAQNFTVTGTDANGCQATASVSVKVNACTGVGETDMAASIQVFPNPAHGQFTVKGERDAVLIVTNAIGQVVREITLESSSEHSVVVTGLDAGIYLVSEKGNVKHFEAVKVIVEK